MVWLNAGIRAPRFCERDLADVGRKTTYLGIAATKCRADNPLREEGIILAENPFRKARNDRISGQAAS